MKKALRLVIICGIVVFIASCSNNSFERQVAKIEDLILKQDKITAVEIQKGQDGIPFRIVKGASEINELLEMIADIPVDRLTKKQDMDYMQNGQKLMEQGFYRVSFYSEEETLSGQFLIWPEGNIYIIDVASMSGSQRTISYLSKAAHTEIYQWMNDKPTEIIVQVPMEEKIQAKYWLGDAGEKIIEYKLKTNRMDQKDLINDKGDTILSGFVEYDLMLELIIAKKEGKWGLYDQAGVKVSEHIYDDLLNPEMPDGYKVNGLVRVKKNGLWGAIDQQGKIVIEPKYDFIHLTYYEEVEPFIKVEKRGKYGYLTRAGQLLVDTVWDNAFMDVLNVPEDIIFVKQGDRWGGIRVDDHKALPVDWGLTPSEEAQLVFNNWKYDYQHDFYIHQIRDKKTDISTTTKIFFNDYFKKNTTELRSLPEFSSGNKPNWDELTKFVYENTDYISGDLSLSREGFAKTVTKYFGGITYTHKDSALLAYKDGKYTPNGWSDHGFYIYEVTNLTKGKTAYGEDSWKAQLTGYYFYETDGDPNQLPSKNAQAVYKEMQKEEYKGLHFGQACDRLVWNNPGSVLEPSSEWLIEFTVSDPLGDIYFTYLSCEKTVFKDQ